MHTVSRLWKALGQLAEAIEHLAALASAAADTIQGHAEGPALLFGQSLPQPTPATTPRRDRKRIGEENGVHHGP